jgi:hypothetical protein
VFPAAALTVAMSPARRQLDLKDTENVVSPNFRDEADPLWF